MSRLAFCNKGYFTSRLLFKGIFLVFYFGKKDFCKKEYFTTTFLIILLNMLKNEHVYEKET